MMKSLVMNVLVAVIWLFLMRGGLVSFIIGMITGFIFLSVFRQVLGSADYTRRVMAFFRFIWVFAREFVLSNITIAKSVVMTPLESIHPNFITYDVEGMRPWEIFLLSQCITLTPGTTTVDLVDEGKTLIVHAFDADAPDEIRESIDQTLKQAILDFSR